MIRYELENGLEHGKTHFFKLRTYGYGLATLGAIGFLVWSMSGHKIIESTARQIRSPLYVTLSDGRILNRYELKVDNKSMYDASFDLSIQGLEGAEVDMGQIKDVFLKPDQRQRIHNGVTGIHTQTALNTGVLWSVCSGLSNRY